MVRDVHNWNNFFVSLKEQLTMMLFKRSNVCFIALIFVSTTQISFSFVSRPSFTRSTIDPRSSVSSVIVNVLSTPNDELGSSDDMDPRRNEFDISQDYPMRETKKRKMRIEQEKKNQETFTPYGNELWDLRSELQRLSSELVKVMACGEDSKEIREQIRRLEQKDANVVYGLELDKMDKALDEGRIGDAEEHKKNALNARNHLVQFNFEGLWVGKYGEQGFRKFHGSNQCIVSFFNPLLMTIFHFRIDKCYLCWRYSRCSQSNRR